MGKRKGQKQKTGPEAGGDSGGTSGQQSQGTSEPAGGQQEQSPTKSMSDEEMTLQLGRAQIGQQQQQQRPQQPRQQHQQQPRQQQQQTPRGAWGQPQQGHAQEGGRRPQQQQHQQQVTWGKQQQQQQQQGAWSKPQQQQQQPHPHQQQQQQHPRQQQPQHQQQQQQGAWGKPQQQQQQPHPQQQQQQQHPQQQPQHEQQQQQQQQQTPGASQGPSRSAGYKGLAKPQAKEEGQRSRPLRASTATILKGTEQEANALPVVIPAKGTGNRPGKKILVETNFLRLNCKDWNKAAYHYDVAIDPDRPGFMQRPAFDAFVTRRFPGRFPSFDGKKNAISAGPLPGIGDGSVTEEVEVVNAEKGNTMSFKVTLQCVNVIDLSPMQTYPRLPVQGRRPIYPQNVVVAIDIILRNMSAMRTIQSGRQFFTKPTGQVVYLGEGLEMWYGFYQSAILGARPYVNIDVAHKGFPKSCNVVELFREMCQWQPGMRLDTRYLTTISRHLRGLKVSYDIPSIPNSKRAYKVNNLVRNAKEEKFQNDQGQMVTVFDYFRNARQYTIRYPELPLLWVGSTAKKIMIPAELCVIVEGQVINRKYSSQQTDQMVRNSVCNTKVRKQRIFDAMHKANLNASPYTNEFGMSVAGEFERVEARVLPPPRLLYHNNSEVPVSKGVWQNRAQFLSPRAPASWCIVNLDDRTRNDALQNCQTMLMQMGRNNGMIFGQPSPIAHINCRRYGEIEDYLRRNKQMDMIFVVVPEIPKDTYSKVKRFAEIHVGVLTQCIKGRTVGRLNQAMVGNILLKVNAKLNGVNHSLAPSSRPKCLERPCMIMGADVSHPAPDSTDSPSMAAVAASHDPKAFQYNMLWRLQEPGVEMIQDFHQITREQLMYFHSKTGYKPEKIIYFRDGVSEGQFKQVLDVELPKIHLACQSIQKDGQYKPKVTIIIVQKRHHTRFFPINDRDCEDRNFNVPAGTCVDREIVNPHDIDFYLQSHASILGTGRPTKYRVIWDDNNMSEVELQELTYYLCHLFSRCNRSVSYPAPTYNAHLAAYRARVYMEGDKVNLENLRKEEFDRRIQDAIQRGSPMFFV